MAKEAKSNKNLIIGICSAVVVIAIIAVVAFVIIKNQKPALNDQYFVSDDSKLVISMDVDDESSDSASPIKQHQVYTYSGDTITGLKNYVEFATEADAKAAYDTYKNSDETSEWFADIELNGKYIIMTSAEEQYKDLTTSAVKQYIELFESLKNLNVDTEETSEE